MDALNLWNPTHVTIMGALVTALLLGLLHGITPDEHTWPITFSYAVGSYSTRGGLRAGLLFSLAFTLQRAITSELAYLGLSRIFTNGPVDSVIYIVVGSVMAISGFMMISRGHTFHLHLPKFERYAVSSLHEGSVPQDGTPAWISDPRPWMPLVHGFIAGWGFGAFALIIYTVLAPAMPSAAWGWAPGALFGIGTTIVQVMVGGIFGWIAARRRLPQEAIRQIALTTASRTLGWGGVAFVLGGAVGLLLPSAANYSLATGLKIHNLSHVGLPLMLVVITVLCVGVPTLVGQTRRWSRRIQAGLPSTPAVP